jgi:membrane fusion protein, multidrug efflux system
MRRQPHGRVEEVSMTDETSPAANVAAKPEAAPAAAAPVPAKALPAPRRKSRGPVRLLLFVVLPVLAIGGGAYAWLHGGRYVSTDNAYVGAQKVLITPEVSGRVTHIAVQEGQEVKVGDDLFEIDPSSYQIAVEQSQAKLAQVRTDFATLKSNLDSLSRQEEIARQTVTLRQADVQRKSELLTSRSGSRADVDTAEISVATARSALETLEQQRQGILNQLKGDANLPLEAYPPYLDAQAALEKAQRDLALTHLTAPIAGTATQVTSIQMGRYLSAGTAVFSIVADDKPWVDANPKETDLTYVKPGQEATITVDAYPDRVWHGTVASISPGTGAQFSILPAQNASGNWVKVVQRVPVRIDFAPGEDVSQLRAGMSTNADIDTRRQRSVAGLLGGIGSSFATLFGGAQPASAATSAQR